MDGSRSRQEVFAHHAQTLAAEGLDGIVADYRRPRDRHPNPGAAHGKDGVRENFV
jgi:hypothetical protein